jgi:hypothetical protein
MIPYFRAHPQLAGQGQAVFAGQADVEHHQFHRLLAKQRFGLFRGGGAVDGIAFLGQVGLEQVTNQRIVVDDQNLRGHCG